jgi:DivIVA domain-containing protein
MAHVLLLLLIAIAVGAVAYGVTWVITGRDHGLDPEEPDGRAVPLPTARPLIERDVQTIRFDTALRGYRMDQVDAATRRAAYDIGYKEELIGVLEAELAALRAGETEEADALRAARESAVSSSRANAKSEDAQAVFPGTDTETSPGNDMDDDTRPGAAVTDTTDLDLSGNDVASVEIDVVEVEISDVADDEPAIRPGATEPEASDSPAAAASRR